MTKINILHVDSSGPNRQHVEKIFAQQECSVIGVDGVEAAIKKIKQKLFDGMIVEGPCVLEEMMNVDCINNAGRIFVLSNDASLSSKERAFSFNIDDYLTYDMDESEVLLRICARLHFNKVELWKGISLDPSGQGFYFAEELHRLTRIEYRILQQLIRCGGETISRDDLINKAWPGEVVLDQTLNTHVSNLRSKIRPIGFDVRALRNKGFKLVD